MGRAIWTTWRINIRLLDPHIYKLESNMNCLIWQNICVSLCNCHEYCATREYLWKHKGTEREARKLTLSRARSPRFVIQALHLCPGRKVWHVECSSLFLLNPALLLIRVSLQSQVHLRQWSRPQSQHQAQSCFVWGREVEKHLPRTQRLFFLRAVFRVTGDRFPRHRILFSCKLYGDVITDIKRTPRKWVSVFSPW